jgi:hypothetical protein
VVVGDGDHDAARGGVGAAGALGAVGGEGLVGPVVMVGRWWGVVMVEVCEGAEVLTCSGP